MKKNSPNRKHSAKRIHYKSAGVNVAAGDGLVDWLMQTPEKNPHQGRVLSGIGGFASLFRLDLSSYQKPCLVTCTDGVGTKVLLAAKAKRYEEVAQDMVAMCVNDLITTGADPLLFLDYFATSSLDLKMAKKFLTGVRKACAQSECILIGGETAEMPGVYKKNDFDCAGFAVGMVDEEKRLGEHRVRAGDIVLGISSNGFHSNGYSLLRKVYAKDLRQKLKMLLRPTHLYVEFAKKIRHLDIHALAHITGGGIENIPRVIPKGLGFELVPWTWPKEFREVQRRSGLSDIEMLKTLNCGIGFVVICGAQSILEVQKIAGELNFKSYKIGVIKEQEKAITYPRGKTNA